MKKLFLHIGTGKTGSTSIQKTFENRSNEFHFDYDMTGPDKLKDVDASIERINCKNDFVVYSNEWLFRADRKYIEKLSLKLKRCFKTEVILCLRRQDEFEISRYQQIGKSGDGPTNGGWRFFLI